MVAMDWATEAMAMVLAMEGATMEAMVWDTGAMVAMDWATGAMAMVLAMEGATMVATGATMASVMLMLSLRLMLTPTTMVAMVWDTEAMAMEDMDWATGATAMVAMDWDMAMDSMVAKKYTPT